VRLGGLGLTSAEGQANAAWCGSWALCWSRMQRFFPALAAVDLATAAPRAAAADAAAAAPGEAAAPSPRLPSLVSLRDAHACLMAQRDEVDTAFKGIDAAAAAIHPRAPARPARPRRPRLPRTTRRASRPPTPCPRRASRLQLLLLAVQWGVAIEIEWAIKKSARSAEKTAECAAAHSSPWGRVARGVL
jgi:hypothetical protein